MGYRICLRLGFNCWTINIDFSLNCRKIIILLKVLYVALSVSTNLCFFFVDPTLLCFASFCRTIWTPQIEYQSLIKMISIPLI